MQQGRFTGMDALVTGAGPRVVVNDVADASDDARYTQRYSTIEKEEHAR
jgi:hypothetical protein